MLANKEGTKMEELIRIIAALDAEEKKIVAKQLDSDILFEELWFRSKEERKSIAEIEETLIKRSTNGIK